VAKTKAKLVLSKYEYTLRHLRTAVRHLSAVKFANALKNNYEYRLKKPILSSNPFFIKVEPTPFCHLRCPGCLHGNYPDLNRQFNKECMLPLEDFKRIIDPIKNSLIGISLSVRGEPLMNPHTLKMAAYCHENNIGATFPTNFSLKFSDEEIDEMVTSGLDHIMISIDGITQEVYGKYRVGGRLDLVLGNAKRLIKAKEKLKSKTPTIEFKFILFNHNKHQVNQAEKLAYDMGFDKFSQVLANESQAGRKEIEQLTQKNRSKHKTCYWPWNNSVVLWDGKICSCCFRLSQEMGNVLEDNFRLVWNNKQYQSLRHFFRSDNADSEYNQHTDCEKCMIF
jgi:radical SAM protein with 4Fe4S-binding SPASM domain